MSILSIQSHVAYGHVGNSAAVFPLQRLGFDVWPVHTVQYSNHLGYGDFAGTVLGAAHVTEVLAGIAARGVLGSCRAVLSGYLGEAAIGEAVLGALAAVRHANPDALYLCDPVMGDIGEGFYVRDGIPEFLRDQAVPAADIVTPNVFELEHLTGGRVATLADALAAARQLLALGPTVVVVTSLRHAETPADRIEMLAVTAAGAWRIATPMVPFQTAPNGAGDAVAALFLGHYLRNRDPAEALAAAGAAIYAVMRRTGKLSRRELALIAAQDEIAKPSRRFPVETLE